MTRKAISLLTVLLSLTSAAWAQLDLNALYTQTVKTGQPWAQIETQVNDLALKVEVDRGVVTTTATLTYTPGPGQVWNHTCEPIRCAPGDVKCEETRCTSKLQQELLLDSLETSAHFSQADNTVITDMHLWVGDVKVRAELQDRALASAQYEDIVKRRKDPALLETWGNGSYSLRIFPNESKAARKIEIQFVQGLESDGRLFKTALPVLQRLAKVAAYGNVDYNTLPNRTIGSVSLTAVALDGNTYDLKWEGLGSGTVGVTPLKLSAASVAELKEGTLSATGAACIGCVTPWISRKAGAGYFGIKSVLEAKGMDFEAEPGQRDFLLDVDARTKDAQVVDRARKVALLSLKAYGGAPYAANLGLADGKGGIAYVFPKAQAMDEAAIRKAYEALKAWVPSADADAHATLRAYARARAAGAPAAMAFLINNDTAAYFYWPPFDDGSKDGAQAKYEAWEKARAAYEDETLAALKAAKVMLFGFWNDYRLSRLATATGGFQVGSMFPYFYYGPRIAVDAVVDKPIDPISGIRLPPLFGPGRPDAYAIADLKVAASGAAVEDLVVLQAQSYWGWWRGGPMVDVAMPMAKRSASADFLPYPASGTDSVTLRLAGKYSAGGGVKFTVTGLWGGLRFTKEISAQLPASEGAGGAGAALWAYQKTEALARDTEKDDIPSLQKLGRDFHIVTRQTSLLALEPGMTLWTETPAREGQTGGRAGELSSVPATGDATKGGIAANGSSVDNLTLEDILNGTVALRGPLAGRGTGAGTLTHRAVGASLLLEWALPAGGDNAVFRILDLSGKVVAELAGERTATGFAARWSDAGRGGAYLVVARSGARTLARKVVVGP